MKIRFLKLSNWFLAAVMGFFGLQACNSSKHINKDKEPEIQPLMYGGPEIRYVEQPEIVLIKDTTTAKKIEKDPANKEDEMQPRMYGGPVKGFEQMQPREPQVTVYGTPTVNYTLKGRVVDNQGKPVKGIQVALLNGKIDPDNLPDGSHFEDYLRMVSDTTDQKGTFEIHTTDNPWNEQSVLVRDIDGSKNGKFQNQVVEVQFEEDPNAEPSTNPWNKGGKIADVTIKMKRK